MDLHISSKLAISDVQKAFSNTFPYLKIEFFKNRNLRRGSDDVKDNLETQHFPEAESIEITGDMKVRELEVALESIFPLHAQVFRLSGNIWLETVVTNDWTLAHQNEQGREISLSAGK